MTASDQRPSGFAVSQRAARTLLDLKTKYHKQLKFRVFMDDNGAFELRVHDREYAGDWTLNVANVGVSFCRSALTQPLPLKLDALRTRDNESGFCLVLFVDDDTNTIVAELDGDLVVRRVLSEEMVVCDAYGEFCYASFT